MPEIYKKFFLISLTIFATFLAQANAQDGSINGKLSANEAPAAFVTVMLKGTTLGAVTDTSGKFVIANVPAGDYLMVISGIGYARSQEKIKVTAGKVTYINKEITSHGVEAQEVVVTGTMKETYTLQSPIKVEVFKAEYLQKNK